MYICCHYQKTRWSIFGMKKQTLFNCLFTGRFRTSYHKTFSLLQWTSTFQVFARPREYNNKSLVWKRRDPESFMAPLSVQRKPIRVCMSPLISAICIITSKSSFSGFHGSLSFVSGAIQFVPWRMCCLCLVLLGCPCPPLPGRCAEGSASASWLGC